MNNEIYHYGVVGMKWGIRRYQNPDGTLTEAGKARLRKLGQASDYSKERYMDNKQYDDIVIKKGTAANRVVKWYGRDAGKTQHATEEDLNKYDNQHINDPNFFSVDHLLNRGEEGKYFYASWFGDVGYDIDKIRIDNYEFKKDVKVANGKKSSKCM